MKHRINSWTDLLTNACPLAFVYLLDHKYSTAELNAARLKGVDRLRFIQLQEACRDNDCEIYLANVEKKVTGSVEDDYVLYGHSGGYGGYGGYGPGRRLESNKNFHAIFDAYAKNLELLHIVDTQGSVAGRNLLLSNNMISR